MDEGGVDDAVRCGRSSPEAVQVVERPAVRAGPSSGKRSRRRIRTSQTEHLMPAAISS